MIESVVLAGAVGLGLGAFFFGGLWWTVRRGVLSPRPAAWFFGSMLLRVTVTLFGFYLVGAGHWERLLASLFGFVVARIAVRWLTRERVHTASQTVQEASHAP